MFNPSRLELARRRCQLSARDLSKMVEISEGYYSLIVSKNENPSEDLVSKFSKVLKYPINFFYKSDIDIIHEEVVSFRSLKSLTVKSKNSAIAAGELAFELIDYLNTKFELPPVDFPVTGENIEPEQAAVITRAHWGIGYRPIGNIVALLEAKGIRVLSLSENTKSLDAYSLWRNNEPYIFLNTMKTSERTRFDAAHELGHLILHRFRRKSGPDVEREADKFASAFLMPEEDIRAEVRIFSSLNQLIALKKRWGVSLKALVYRLHKIGLMSDWQYKMANINIAKKWGNTEEPEPISRNTSLALKAIFLELWKMKISREQISLQTCIPEFELNGLLEGLLSDNIQNKQDASNLRLVINNDE